MLDEILAGLMPDINWSKRGAWVVVGLCLAGAVACAFLGGPEHPEMDRAAVALSAVALVLHLLLVGITVREMRQRRPRAPTP